MAYPEVFFVTFDANLVTLDLKRLEAGPVIRLDMDEANTLIDQLIQATRSALSRGAIIAPAAALLRDLQLSNRPGFLGRKPVSVGT